MAAAAIEYAVDEGADVINASWGSEQPSTTLLNAVQYADDANVLIVAAAGNEVGINFYPAKYSTPNVLSVAAIRPSGYLASFSNRGSWVDMAAPGQSILVACVSGCPSGYAIADGTSFAAPHVAGVAAQVLAGEARAARQRRGAAQQAHQLGRAQPQARRGADDERAPPQRGLRARHHRAVRARGQRPREARLDHRDHVDGDGDRVVRLHRRDRHRVVPGPLPQDRHHRVDHDHRCDDRPERDRVPRLQPAVRAPGHRPRSRREHHDDDRRVHADALHGVVQPRDVHRPLVPRGELELPGRQGAGDDDRRTGRSATPSPGAPSPGSPRPARPVARRRSGSTGSTPAR